METAAATPSANTPGFSREALAAALFLTALVVLATHYHGLPARLHSPFNGGGDHQGMAGKSQLWLLLFLGWWLYVVMSLINLFGSDSVHWPTPLSAEQNLKLLQRCRAFMGWFKVAVMAGLAFWMWQLCNRPH